MLMINVNVNEYKFSRILDGTDTLIIVEGNVLRGEVFSITEEGIHARRLFARMIECISLEQTRHKKFLGLIPYGEKEFMTVARFDLTGMIQVDGKEVPMSEPVTNEIYKTLDETKPEIDLKLCPLIVCTNKKNEIVAEFKFISCIVNEGNDIQAVTIHHKVTDGLDFTGVYSYSYKK